MSPEQLREEDVDGRSDLWSLAVVLYESLTGGRPFRGRGLSLAQAIVGGELEPPSCVVASLPISFDEWFAKALSVSRDDRFATAEALATSFDRLCAGTSWGAALSAPRGDEPTITAATPREAPDDVGRSLDGSETAVHPRTTTRWLPLSAVTTATVAAGWLLWFPSAFSPATIRAASAPLRASNAVLAAAPTSAPVAAPVLTSAPSAERRQAHPTRSPMPPPVASGPPSLYEDVPF